MSLFHLDSMKADPCLQETNDIDFTYSQLIFIVGSVSGL